MRMTHLCGGNCYLTCTKPVQEMQELYKAFKLREFEKKSSLERGLVVALPPLEDKFSK